MNQVGTRIHEAFGVKLKRIRKRKRLRQDLFAEKLGVSRTTASKIERGKQRVSLDQLYRIAHILEADPAELLPNLAIDYNSVLSASDDPLSASEFQSVESAIRELIPAPR